METQSIVRAIHLVESPKRRAIKVDKPATNKPEISSMEEYGFIINSKMGLIERRVVNCYY